MPRGGLRKGAGRKLGSGKGRVVVTRCVCLKPEEWKKIDALRGAIGLSAWIRGVIEKS
jgi:hypothetical protein